MTTIIELQSTLQNLKKKKITFVEIGEALGTGRANISKRANTNSHLKADEIEKIESYFEVKLTDLENMETMSNNDIIKIPYWPQLPEQLKNPDFTCVTAEKKVIENHWYLKPEDLCIVPMVGDKMAHYWYPIGNNDILIVDTSQNYIRGNGVYFATSQNNSRFWIREMQVLVNDDVEFKGFSPSGETTRVLSKEELQAVDFRVIGKVIKNVSFRL